MLPEELFKKLRPIFGKEIEPLQAFYLSGDSENKRSIEQFLRVVYSNATGIKPPPVRISSGDCLLGMVLSGNKELYPFYLRDEDWFHLGIFGLTGRGKTNTALHLLNELQENNIPWLVFDWKRAGYRDLDDVNVFTVGRDVSPFYFNPLIPPCGVDEIAWYKQFIKCISHAYFLGHGCEIILQDVIGKCSTVSDVLKKLQAYPAKWRKLQWLQSTERAVKALCYGGISDVLNVQDSLPISHWLDKNVVLELDALTESEAKFFVDIVMSAIYFYRRENRDSGFLHVNVIEEAHNVLKREHESKEAKSVMDKVFREIREYGESIVLIDQMPSTILESAFANTATQITLNLKNGKDVSTAGSAMLLDRDEQFFLGKLSVGVAVVKLQNRWHSPFFIKLPYLPIKRRKTTDKLIRERMKGYFRKREVISPGESQREVISLISEKDKKVKKLLMNIVEEPLLGIVERYESLGLNPREGNRIKKKLIELDFVKEVSISTSKGRIKLLELTEKGKEELGMLGLPKRHGGVEHLYWLEQVKRKLESAGYKVKKEFSIGNGESVDLAVLGNKKIAVEVETGKSDAIYNIRKCLKAGFDGVISVATDKKTEKSIKKGLREFEKEEREKVRVGGVGNLG